MSRRRIGGPVRRYRKSKPRARRPTSALRRAPTRPQPPPPSSSFFELTERYPTEQSAEAYFVAMRWPDGVRCANCASADVYDCKAKRTHTLWKCRACGHQFTVTSGTIMQNTRIPLRKWLFAYHLLGGARHGLSTRYLARQLGITVKSAWHLTHRIRDTMTKNDQYCEGGIVESDEAYIGGRRRGRGRGYRGNKIPVQVVIERKFNNRDLSDKEIAEAAIRNMEGKRVTLFKSQSGAGEFLIDYKRTDKPKHGTLRGSSKHARTGRKKAAPLPAASSPSEALRVDSQRQAVATPLGTAAKITVAKRARRRK